MLALVLVAVSLGLSNFAAAVGIGVSGIDGRTRLRVGLIFGLFEAGMPIVGLLLGLSHHLRRGTSWVFGQISLLCSRNPSMVAPM